MQANKNEVRFDIYCKKCEFYSTSASNDPCNDCLGHPYNEDSHTPVRFKQVKSIINYLLPDPVVDCYTRDPLRSANWVDREPTDAELKKYFEKRDDGNLWEVRI